MTLAYRQVVVAVGLQALRFCLSVASIPIVTRYLTPAEIGAFATALVFYSFASVIRDGGIGTLMLQSPTYSTALRTTYFWTTEVLSLTCAVALFVLGLILAYSQWFPDVANLLMGLALLLPVAGAQTIYAMDLARRSRNDSVNLATFIGFLCGLGSCLFFVSRGWGAWALVIQAVISTVVTLCILLPTAMWLPAAPWRSPRSRGLIVKSLPLAGSQVSSFVASNADTLVVAWRYDSSSVGIYDRAFQLVSAPVAQISGPLMQVIVPRMSRLHLTGADAKLQRNIRLACASMMFTAGLVLAAVATASSVVVPLLFGPGWADVGLLLPIFAVGAIAQLQVMVYYWIFLAVDHARQLLWFAVTIHVSSLVIFVVTSGFSVEALAVGVASAHILAAVLGAVWLSRLVPLHPLGLMGPWMMMMTIAALMLIAESTVMRDGSVTDVGVAIILAAIVSLTSLSVFVVRSRNFPEVRTRE